VFVRSISFFTVFCASVSFLLNKTIDGLLPIRGKNEEQKLLLQGTHVPRTQKSIIIPFLHKDIIASHLVKEV